MKKHLLKSLLALALVLISGSAWGANETIIFSDLGLTNGTQYSDPFDGGSFTVTFAGGANDGKYYTTGSAIRVYGGGTMTVSSSTNTIEKIELTFGSGDGSNTITVDAGKYSDGTWTGSASSVVFTVGGTSGHRRIASVAVTYAAVAVTGVSLDKSDISLYVGTTETLTATIAPTNAANKTVTWSSSDDAVASVVNGVVTGESAGTATITVTTEDGSKTATCAVTVNSAVNVTGVTLDQTELSLVIGETETLTATVSPSNATIQDISWSSSDDAVATVDDGVVTAVAAGSATITVTTVDGSMTATCSVTVSKISVTSVALDKSELSIANGETATLVATVLPANATDKTISWSSNNEEVATVSDGVVTAVAEGTATITVTTTDGSKTASCEVTVVKPEYDLLTYAFTGIEGTGYAEWSGKQGLSSGVKYAGQSAGNNNENLCIQIRSNNNNSGIITTSRPSDNKRVSKIVIEWNSSSTKGRTIDVYGKSSAYSSPTDLYDDSKQGTLLGSIVYGNSTELIIDANATSDCIGLRSRSGAMYINKIMIYWEQYLPVTISAAGWATLCLPFDALIPSGVTAYAITGVNGESLVMEELTDGIVAGEGVLLKGTEGTVTNVTFTEKIGKFNFPSDNLLIGTTKAGGETFDDGGLGGTSFYILANDPTDGIGFYYQVDGGSSATCAQYKAVLRLATKGAPAIGFRLDGATKIDAVPAATEDAAIYDLTGRRVENATRGIYIAGGKKVVVK